MKKSLLFTLGLLAFLSACNSRLSRAASQTPVASPTPTEVPTPVSLFEYDSSVPFDVQVRSEYQQGDVSVIDLTYATHDPAFSPNTAGRTLAYLVRPSGEGPFAGIIYLHWLGEVKGNRNEYLPEAVDIARHGAICLVLQGYFPWMAVPRGTAEDTSQIIGQVIELRRAIDFILAQPGIDPARVGFVGHDYGALYGGVLAGIDHRLKTYVLLGGVPSFADWIRFFQIDPAVYAPIVKDIDPIVQVRNAAPASLLFQFGQRDSYVPEDQADQFFEAASEPKQVEWFDDVHELHSQPVSDARLSWLIEQLDLRPAP